LISYKKRVSCFPFYELSRLIRCLNTHLIKLFYKVLMRRTQTTSRQSNPEIM